MSIDASYIVQTPTVKARLTGFYTQFVDATEVSFFYAQGISGAEVTQDFFSEALTGVNKTHMGLELGTEVQLNTTFKATAVAALGQYTYSNNPEVYLSSDQISTRSFGPSALKDYRVANGPQQPIRLGWNTEAQNIGGPTLLPTTCPIIMQMFLQFHEHKIFISTPKALTVLFSLIFLKIRCGIYSVNIALTMYFYSI